MKRKTLVVILTLIIGLPVWTVAEETEGQAQMEAPKAKAAPKQSPKCEEPVTEDAKAGAPKLSRECDVDDEASKGLNGNGNQLINKQNAVQGSVPTTVNPNQY